MRVNPNPWSDYLTAIDRTQQDLQKAMQELSTGQRVSQPSDDPAAAALLVNNQDEVTLSNRYLQNIASVQGQMQVADSTLGSIVTELQRAISLGVEGANGTLSDQDRGAIAAELDSIKSQLVFLSNTAYQGRYLFSGTETAQPFVVDSSQPSGVRYDGNTGVNNMQIGDGYSIAVNKPGSEMFMSSGGDMFRAITDLTAAMQSNSGYDAALSELHAAFDTVSTKRVFYGATMNQAQAQNDWLNSTKLQLSNQQDALAAADLPATATRLANDQNSLSATFSAMSHYQQMNLFDFLR